MSVLLWGRLPANLESGRVSSAIIGQCRDRAIRSDVRIILAIDHRM